MADRRVVLMPVKTLTHVLFIEMVIVTQPAHQALLQIRLLLYAKVEFGAVAGRENDAALHHGLGKQAVERLFQHVRPERDAFAQRDRCSFMIDSESEQRHGDKSWDVPIMSGFCDAHSTRCGRS